jgi:release factor glutamine methyltransferase
MASAHGISGLDAVSIVASALSVRKEEILANPDRELSEDSSLRALRFFEQRRQGKPHAYITKEKEFFSETFYVDERVLIPRPETETLVEEALRILDERPKLASILDMGTGSGAIGLTVAKRANRRVVCVDISLDALSLAKRNGERLGVSQRVDFVCSDLFGCIREETKFDMVLANLPYVAREEWDDLMTDVKDYEPRRALDGGPGGTILYDRLFKELPHHLKGDGWFICEVGGNEQAERLKDLLEPTGLRVVIKKDLSGIERILLGSWISSS